MKTSPRTRRLALASVALGLLGLSATSRAGDGAVRVSLKAPLLVCHEQSGGVRPPDANASTKDAKPHEHDLIFFVLAGRLPDGSELKEVIPKEGKHLAIDNQRHRKLLKNVPIWEGSLGDGEQATLVLCVREQDGDDSADEDLKEAAKISAQVDNSRTLKQLSRISVDEILQGKTGENDHIGTVVMRIVNEKGKVRLEAEPGPDSQNLKGHSSLHRTRRAFKMRGDHSDYDLHLEVD